MRKANLIQNYKLARLFYNNSSPTITLKTKMNPINIEKLNETSNKKVFKKNNELKEKINKNKSKHPRKTSDVIIYTTKDLSK